MKHKTHISNFIVAICFSVMCFGCATGSLKTARTEFYNGNPVKAAETLENATKISSKNKLLYHMERGLILHELGWYKESADELLKASDLIKEYDIVSLSEQGTSLVTNEWVIKYKGEYSEKLWVHTYLMMNFLHLNDEDAALVEAKQALEILDEREKVLSKDYFTRALIAFCFENAREYDGAIIEYKKLAETMANPSSVYPQLYRLSRIRGFSDDVAKYRKLMTKEELDYLQKERPTAEIVVFLGTGQIPHKVPGDIFIPPSHRVSFPRYDFTSPGIPDITPFQEDGQSVFHLNMSVDTGNLVKSSLDARRAVVLAKETARVVAKDAIADSIGDNNSTLELVVRIAFLLMENADVRCWQTLPGNLTMVRIPVKAGPHHLKAIITGGSVGRKEVMLPEINLSPRQKAFISFRLDQNDSIIKKVRKVEEQQ